MRLRGWLVVGISVVLLIAAGLVGIAVNRSALKAADDVHHADLRALAANNGSLIGELQLQSAKELSDYAAAHPFTLVAGDAADRTSLKDLVAKSTYFRYGAVLTDLTGGTLDATRLDVPSNADAGYVPMREGLLSSGPGYSSVMTIGTTHVSAVAIPLVVGGTARAILIGYLELGTSQLQAYMERLAAPDYVSVAVDSTGRVAAATDPDLLNTVADAPLMAAVGNGVTFVSYTHRGVSMVGVVAGGTQGGWAYMRLQTKAVFQGLTHSRSLTVNLTLLAMLFVGVVGVAFLGYRSQLQRRRAEERFEALVQHAPDVVAVLDGDGTLTYTSPSAATILGREPGAMLGNSVFAIVHPQDRPAVEERLADLRRRRGRTTRLQCRVIHENGSFRWFDLTATNQLHNPALSGIVVNARDISASREFQEKLAHEAYHDPLTGLPNRRRLQQRLASLHDTPVAVLFVDLDAFKPVNDSLGHAAGDDLLRQVGDRLTTCLRQGDVLARVGGDEFVLLLPGLVSTADADTVVRRIRDLLEQSFDLSGHTVRIGASVGVHLAGPTEQPDDVLKAADAAMYAVKRATGRR